MVRYARNILVALLLAAAPAGALAVPAAAQDLPNGSSGRVHYDHYRDRGDDHRHWRRHADRKHDRWDRHDDWDRRDNRSRNRVIIEDGDIESAGGTYSGGVSGYRETDNGTYFYVERDGRSGSRNNVEVENPAPGPKVISPGTAGSACSMQSGVCVIRPGS